MFPLQRQVKEKKTASQEAQQNFLNVVFMKIT